MSKKKSFAVGDFVFAKVKGYPPWPAKITEEVNKGKHHVLFYATGETANLKVKDIFNFVECKEKFGANKKPQFTQAMKELEDDLNPGDDSNKCTVTLDRVKEGSGVAEEETDGEGDSVQKSDHDESESDQKDNSPPPAKKKKKPVKPTATKKQAKKSPARKSRAVVDDSSESGEDDKPEPVKPAHKKSTARGKRAALKSDSTEEDTTPVMTARGSRGRRSKVTYKEETSEDEDAHTSGRKKKKASSSESEDMKPPGDMQINSDLDSDYSDPKLRPGSPVSSGSEDCPDPALGNFSKESDVLDSGDTDQNKNDETKNIGGDTTKSDSTKEQVGDDNSKDQEVDSPKKVPKEAVTHLPDRRDSNSSRENNSATNSSVDDDDIVVQRAHKKSSHRHTVLSDSEEEEVEEESKELDLEQMLWEKEKKHRELKIKKQQEKMEERRKRQLEKQKEQEEKDRAREEKKRDLQQKAKTERRMRELDEIIKLSLAVNRPNVPKCVQAMKDLDELIISAQMIVKYPAIIDTLKKCRKFKAAKQICDTAETLRAKFKSIAASDKSALEALSKQAKVNKKDSSKVKEEIPVYSQVEQDDEKPPSQTEEHQSSAAMEKQAVDSVGEALEEKLDTQLTTEKTSNVDSEPTSNAMDIDEKTLDNTEPHTEKVAKMEKVEETQAPDTETVKPTKEDTNTEITTVEPVSSTTAGEDNSKPISSDPASDVVDHGAATSVSDLLVNRDELPPEDLLQARIRAIIDKTQESAALLEETMKQRKEKRSSSSQHKKRRKLDAGLPEYVAPKATSKSNKSANSSHKSKGDVDDAEIHDLLGI